MRVGSADTVDFFGLTRRKLFFGVEAPASGEKALAAKDLVDARDASVELVCGIEEGSIGIGNLGGEGERIGRDSIALRKRKVSNRSFGPDRPMAEQAANDANALGSQVE